MSKRQKPIVYGGRGKNLGTRVPWDDAPPTMSKWTVYYQRRSDILAQLFPLGGIYPVIKPLTGIMSDFAPYGVDFFDFCTFACPYCIKHFVRHSLYMQKPQHQEKEKIYVLFDTTDLRDELIEMQLNQPVLICPYCDPYSGTKNRLERTKKLLEAFRYVNTPFTIMTKNGASLLSQAEYYATFRDVIQVGTTLLTCDYNRALELEPKCQAPMKRVVGLRKNKTCLNNTFVNLCPLLSFDDAFSVIEKTYECTDWYYLGAYEGTDDYRAKAGVTEPLQETLEKVVEVLRDAEIKFLVGSSLAAQCPDVKLSFEEGEKTSFWKYVETND